MWYVIQTGTSGLIPAQLDATTRELVRDEPRIVIIGVTLVAMRDPNPNNPPLIATGDTVHIKAGALKGMIGTIKSLSRTRAVVEVVLYNIKLPLLLNQQQLEVI